MFPGDTARWKITDSCFEHANNRHLAVHSTVRQSTSHGIPPDLPSWETHQNVSEETGKFIHPGRPQAEPCPYHREATEGKQQAEKCLGLSYVVTVMVRVRGVVSGVPLLPGQRQREGVHVLLCPRTLLCSSGVCLLNLLETEQESQF